MSLGVGCYAWMPCAVQIKSEIDLFYFFNSTAFYKQERPQMTLHLSVEYHDSDDDRHHHDQE